MRNIIITFLRQVLRHLRGPLVLLWDGGQIHRRRDVRAFLRRHPRVEVHRFPGYAPELNPDEFVWTHKVYMDDLLEKQGKMTYKWTLEGTNSGPGGTDKRARGSARYRRAITQTSLAGFR